MKFRFRRPAHRPALAALLLALAGCGVGVVGTGSGKIDEGSKGIAFEPADLCAAPFAPSGLACPDPTGTRPEGGTDAVRWTGAPPAARATPLVADLAASTLRLAQPCERLDFVGVWARLADGSRAFVGQSAGPGDAPPRLALAYVTPAAEEPDAVGWLELLDPGGERIAGPWLMRRTAPGPAPACPG